MGKREDALREFQEFCSALPPMPDKASHVHVRLMDAMVAAGYRVFQEYTVELENGNGGRIDVVAQDINGEWLAIEIDARKPRERSIKKLMTKDWLRICCLRGVEGGPEMPAGIDAVIALPVRWPTRDERAHKARIPRAHRGWPHQ